MIIEADMKSNQSQHVVKSNYNWNSEAVLTVRSEKEKFRDSEDLEGLKDILESVILQLSHFPLEFIQNAEDEESSEIKFILLENALIIYNNGRPFRIEGNRNDIKGICSVGISQKHEKGIGFLGVGSKTMFIITNKPWIVSGKYNFTVEDMLYPSPCNGLPLDVSAVMKDIEDFPNRGAIFYLPLLPDPNGKVKPDEINKILWQLDQSVIMFLNHVKVIQILDLRAAEKSITITRQDIQLLRDSTPYVVKKIQLLKETSDEEGNRERHVSDWIVGSLDYKTSKKARESLPNKRLYEKKRSSRRTRASIAIPVNSEKLRTFPLYCYLPLEESHSGMPFILQGDFVPSPDRNYIRTDFEWNIQALKHLGELYGEMVRMCHKHTELEIPLHDLLPYTRQYPDYIDTFIISFKKTVLDLSFKLDTATRSIPLKNYLICDPESDFLTPDDLRLINLHKHNLILLSHKDKLCQALEWIGVRSLNADDMFKILRKKILNRQKNAIWIFNCYYLLSKYHNDELMDDMTKNLMHRTKWLLNNKIQITLPHDRLYFRMPKARSKIKYIDDFIEVEFLHPIFTTFSGSKKYEVDKNKREAIRKFLTEEFGVKKLEDEGHLVRNLVLPLLRSKDISRTKRIQYFSALIYYSKKLQKKLMRDSGDRRDFQRGVERLREKCKDILVPTTACNAVTKRQHSSGLQKVEEVYLREGKKGVDTVFSIFKTTPGVYFLSTSFYNRIKKYVDVSNEEIFNNLADIGITRDIKILKKRYSGADITPFPVRSHLLRWSLIDYEIPGFNKINPKGFRKASELIYFLLRGLSNKYDGKVYGRSFLDARFTSAGSSYSYDSSILRILQNITMDDKSAEERHLNEFVYGEKFKSLLPDHPLLLPFETRGMKEFLNGLGMRNKPSKNELLNGVNAIQKKCVERANGIYSSDLKRLFKIYKELSLHESVSLKIYHDSPLLTLQWFEPSVCYWKDSTTQFKRYYPVIGEFYKSAGELDYEVFEKFGVKEEPSIDDVFNRLSRLRVSVNRSNKMPSHELLTELRWYYRFLADKSVPTRFLGRKIFLNDTGRMVSSNHIYSCHNLELHSVLSKKIGEQLISSNINFEFPRNLERIFGIKRIDSLVATSSVPQGEMDYDLTVAFKLILKMVVVLVDSFLDNNKLYFVNIQDEERILSRVREDIINTILRGYSHNTINFAKQLIEGGIDIYSVQESFFKQGFSENHIRQFLHELKKLKEIKDMEEIGEDEDRSDDGDDGGKGKPRKDESRKKRKEEGEISLPEVVNPFEYEVSEIKEGGVLDGSGKEIGFRKKRKKPTKVDEKDYPTAAIPPLGIQEISIELVMMACKELFEVEDDKVKDVHRELKEYDVLVLVDDEKKYVEVKASLSKPTPGLTRDQFEKAKIEKDNYYLFLVGNIQLNKGDVYVRYVQNPAAHKYVRLGGARLKEVNWDDWGKVSFGKRS
jgi:hypothetical protein